MPRFVRFQSAVPNRRGVFPGLFALANGLAHAGTLNREDYAWWRRANDENNSAYIDPSTVNESCFDHGLNPGAASWFKASANTLIATCGGYLDLLDRYGVPWTELRTDHPGVIIYEGSAARVGDI